jgi:hypothetical protein
VAGRSAWWDFLTCSWETRAVLLIFIPLRMACNWTMAVVRDALMANHSMVLRGWRMLSTDCRNPSGRAGDELDSLVALAPGFSLRCHHTFFHRSRLTRYPQASKISSKSRCRRRDSPATVRGIGRVPREALNRVRRGEVQRSHCPSYDRLYCYWCP